MPGTDSYRPERQRTERSTTMSLLKITGFSKVSNKKSRSNHLSNTSEYICGGVKINKIARENK